MISIGGMHVPIQRNSWYKKLKIIPKILIISLYVNSIQTPHTVDIKAFLFILFNDSVLYLKKNKWFIDLVNN